MGGFLTTFPVQRGAGIASATEIRIIQGKSFPLCQVSLKLAKSQSEVTLKVKTEKLQVNVIFLSVTPSN